MSIYFLTTADVRLSSVQLVRDRLGIISMLHKLKIRNGVPSPLESLLVVLALENHSSFLVSGLSSQVLGFQITLWSKAWFTNLPMTFHFRNHRYPLSLLRPPRCLEQAWNDKWARSLRLWHSSRLMLLLVPTRRQRLDNVLFSLRLASPEEVQ